MNKRSLIHKKADSSASNPVRSQFQSRPNISQAKQQSQKPLTQTETENGEFQQQKFEATKLEIQAKNGTITPEGQEQLTVLQAKMSGTFQRILKQASSNGSTFANIPISRPDAPSQLARPDTPTPVQAKLTIGEPGDKYEREADEIARKVMSMPAVAQLDMGTPEQTNLQVRSQPLAAKITPLVQHKAMPQSDRPLQGASEFESRLRRSKGGGSPLPKNVQAYMAPRLGADLSDRRVHTGKEAVQMNQEIGALAFTHGKDIYYGAGQSPRNDELTAHELAHTFQQTGSAVQRSQHSVSKITLPSVGDRVIQLTEFPEQDTGEYGDVETNDENDVLGFLESYRDGDLENDNINPEIWDEIKKAIKSGKYNQEKAKIEEILVQSGKATNEELGTSVEAEKISDEDRIRMEKIDKMHAELYKIFQSNENKEKLNKITEVQEKSPQSYVIYRGEWYERALSILKQGTFGGLPKAESDKLLNVTDELFQKNARMQKERGDDKPKEVVNEWTTNLDIAKQYGNKFVTLVALVGKDNPKISHPKEDTGRSEEQGVMADSRMEVFGIAILNMNKSPDYTKKLKGGS